MVRPFRFIAAAPPVDGTVAAWRDRVRHIEDLGFSSLAISEHLSGGWAMEPLIALTAAAGATQRLRLLSLVLGNDFRQPVMLHKAAATIDVFSEGRLELGIGAGWLRADYAATGIAFDPPAVRVDRLGEAVTILKRLFAGPVERFQGRYYCIEGAEGLPRPVQQPHPPLMIGGGGRAILGLAAREADIIGIHAALRGRTVDGDAAADLAADRIFEKVAWVRAAATAAGRDPDTLDLQSTVYLARIDGSRRAAGRRLGQFAEALGADPALVASSPAVLVGSLEQCVETLIERREHYGFNYLKLAGDPDEIAPIVARLGGH
jgi:probable F420-dependent oxidoreductase